MLNISPPARLRYNLRSRLSAIHNDDEKNLIALSTLVSLPQPRPERMSRRARGESRFDGGINSTFLGLQKSSTLTLVEGESGSNEKQIAALSTTLEFPDGIAINNSPPCSSPFSCAARCSASARGKELV